MWENPIENIVGKGENYGYQHFLLFPTIFLTFPGQIPALNPLRNDTILGWPKLQEFAADEIKFAENNRKFSIQVENTGKRRNYSL